LQVSGMGQEEHHQAFPPVSFGNNSIMPLNGAPTRSLHSLGQLYSPTAPLFVNILQHSLQKHGNVVKSSSSGFMTRPIPP
jgi:hypothetical protein